MRGQENDCLAKKPYHGSFLHLIIVNRSMCGPLAYVTSMSVTLSMYKIPRSLL